MIFVGAFVALMALVTCLQKAVVGYYQLREVRELVTEYEVQDLSSLTDRIVAAAAAGEAPVQPSAPPAAEVMGVGVDLLSSNPMAWLPATEMQTQRSLNMDL